MPSPARAASPPCIRTPGVTANSSAGGSQGSIRRISAPSCSRSLYRSAEFSVEGWWASLLLVQAWQFPVPGVWNVPAWSISAEWAAYLLFPLLVLPVRRLREPRRVMLAIALVYRSVEEPARRGLTRRWLRRGPLPS